MLFQIFLFISGCSGNPYGEVCFEEEFLQLNNIVPADRGEQANPIRLGKRNWASHTLLVEIVDILMSEAMGYKTVQFEPADSLLAKYSWMEKEDLSDLDIESWIDSDEYIKELTIDKEIAINFGSIGFSGLEGIYSASYMDSSFYQMENPSASPMGLGMDQTMSDYFYPFYFATLQSQPIVNKLAVHTPHKFWEETLKAGGTAPSSPFNEPSYVYPTRASNSDHNSVFVNTLLCDTESTIQSSRKGDCATWICAGPDWATPEIQGVVVNNQLRVNAEFHGSINLKLLVKKMLEHYQPVFWYWWTPDPFLATLGDKYKRVTLPAKDRTSDFNFNMTNMDGLHTSWNADFQPSALLKIGRKKTFMDPWMQDAKTLLFKLQLTEFEIMDLVAEEAPVGLDQWKVACKWLKANTSKWLKTISNTYKRPKPQFMGPGVQVTWVALFLVLVVLGLVGVGLTILWREKKMVRLSQYRINVLVVFGILTAMFGLYFGTRDEESLSTEELDAACQNKIICFHMGMALFFGPIASKLFRIKNILVQKNLRVVSITDWDLLKYISLYVVCVGAYLTAWMLVDPPIRKVFTESGLPEEPKITYGYCANENLNWELAIVSIHAVTVVVVSQWAWLTRKVFIPAANDSKRVGIIVGTVLIIGAFEVPLAYMIRDPFQLIMFQMMGTFSVSLLSISLLYMPIIHAVLSGSEESWTENVEATRIKATGKEFDEAVEARVKELQLMPK